MSITFRDKNEIVRVSKLFQTFAQNDPNYNSEGDEERLKKQLKELDDEFMNKVNKTLNKF